MASLVRSSVDRAGPIWDELTKPLRDAVRSAASYDDLGSRLGGMSFDFARAEQLLVDAQTAGWVLGNGQVGHEAGLIRGIAKTWEPMPPEEAIEWLRSRQLLDADAWSSASEAIRARSFGMARQQSEMILEGVRSRIVTALGEGQAFSDFAASYAEMTEALGITPTSPHHLETVFRTNAQTATNVGRYQRSMDPVVLRLRPYWQYRTAGDGDVRESHAALDGLIAQAGDTVWGTIYPPNGYNCRCLVVTLSARQLAGREVVTKIPDGVEVEFATNPAETWGSTI